MQIIDIQIQMIPKPWEAQTVQTVARDSIQTDISKL